jgi:hypothetical protein
MAAPDCRPSAIFASSRRPAAGRLNSGVRPQMQERNIPTKVLLTETLRLFLKFLLLVALVGIAHIVVYFSYGSSSLLAVVIAAFFSLTFFSAPLSCSYVRAKRGVRFWTRAGGNIVLFCFVWGGIVVAGFIATLQLLQGMGATAWDYAAAMAGAGLVCAVTAMIPGGR